MRAARSIGAWTVCILTCAGCLSSGDGGGTPVRTGAQCNELASHLRSCNMLTDGEIPACGGDSLERCLVECFLAFSCSELEQALCTEDQSPEDSAVGNCLSDCAMQTEEAQLSCESGDESYPEAFQCDGDEDCSDGSDEAGCPQYTCADGMQSIPEGFRCDDFPDCSDGSDEEGCPQEADLVCPDGQEPNF